MAPRIAEDFLDDSHNTRYFDNNLKLTSAIIFEKIDTRKSREDEVSLNLIAIRKKVMRNIVEPKEPRSSREDSQMLGCIFSKNLCSKKLFGPKRWKWVGVGPSKKKSRISKKLSLSPK